MFQESEHQQHLRFPDWDEADRDASPRSVRVRKPGADENHWLELSLYQLEAGVRRAGKEAVLYCGACKTKVAYGHVVPGSVQGWPYCPRHRDRPLMVCSVSLRLERAGDRHATDPA